MSSLKGENIWFRVVNYILLFVLFSALILIVYRGLQADNDKIYYWHVWMDALFFALPAWFCKKRTILFPYIILAVLYLLSIVWYGRTYYTLMPLDSYLLIDNLDGLGESILYSMRLSDFPFLALTLLYMACYCWVCRYRRSWLQAGGRARRAIAALVFLLVCIGTTAPYWPNERQEGKQPLYLYRIANTSAIKKFGILNYWIYQGVSLRGASEAEKQYAVRFVRQLDERADWKSLAGGQRHNLILILVESLQSWPVGMSIEGVEVTPCLNRLLEDTTTVYFPHMVPQVRDGRSSDAHLIVNTGLLPLVTGAASSMCVSNSFLSLPAALKEKGYASVAFACEPAPFWNLGKMTFNYGFDKLYAGLQDDWNRQKADSTLFAKAVEVLSEMEQPYYAQLITYSTHQPYNEVLLPDSPLLEVDLPDEEVRNCLISIQYTDRHIGRFLGKLKEMGVYDRSIIVITGDHEQMGLNRYENRERAVVEDLFVPFMVLNSPVASLHTDKVVGQMDIYPSLLHLMGCDDYGWKGLGETLFGEHVSDCASYRNEVMAEGVHASDAAIEYRKECWIVSDILLRMDYFREQ